MPPFCLLSPCFLFNYAMSITRLAVNWFNYPICLWQAWFQPNCSSCGRRWQTVMWRRRTAPNNGHRGLDLSSPSPVPPKNHNQHGSTNGQYISHSLKREEERRHMWDYLYSVYRVLGIIEASLSLLKVEIPSREARLMDRYPQGISCIWILIYRC